MFCHKTWKLLIISFFFMENTVEGLKILSVFAVPAKSHAILGQALSKGLVEAGHEVTMVSPYPLDKPMKNYRDIVIENKHDDIFGHQNESTFEAFQGNAFIALYELLKLNIKYTESLMEDKEIQKLINSKENFDVIILEAFMEEPLYGLAHHFNAHLIILSSIGPTVWTNNLVGNMLPFAAFSDMMLGYSDPMVFVERVFSSVYSSVHSLMRNYWYIPRQDVLMRKHFKNAPPLDEIMTNTSLVLLNSHVSMSRPTPLVPNMIEIGGYHVGESKQLPEDLQKYLDNSPQGVIYFSMGSNIRSRDLSTEKRDAFLKVFGNLKQNVIWKWEDEKLPNQPKNLKIGKWFPQQDILAHPNVKVFITHGGLLSTTEAITRGVPIIGIPIFGDQRLNMVTAQSQGYGIIVDFTNITDKSLSWALNEVLTNSRWDENIKHRSQILHDQQVKPLQKAIYWIEYVVRHNGAHHLRCSTTGMPLYKYLLLDVITVVVLICIVLISIILFTIRKICNKCICCKKDRDGNINKKKN